jgi:hypothetical protein
MPQGVCPLIEIALARMFRPRGETIQSIRLMRSIDYFDLRSFDLNLLVAFDALMG